MSSIDIRAIHDFDELDYVQMYTILQNAKELLRYLHDLEDFSYDAYYDGSSALQTAMAYIDNNLLHPDPENFV